MYIALIPLVFLAIWIIDRLITKERLKINQIEWNEYSQEMTSEEKDDKFLEWLEMSKAKHGWGAYYIPHK